MSVFGSFSKRKTIPEGVRVLTKATAVRWIGWGFAEPLIPILLLSFSHTFAQAGLLRATYDIAFLLALPMVGAAADRLPATTLILLGLGLYVFVGAGYFLAGLTGLAIFIVLARLMNGLTYALDVVGRETYFRRHVPKDFVATVFGYFDTVANFWWIAAAFAGMVLLRWFTIPALLFLIAPTSLIAWIIIFRFRQRSKEVLRGVSGAIGVRGAYIDTLKEIGKWTPQLREVAALNFFIAFAGTVMAFFLPIEAYAQGAGFSRTILIGIFFALPSLFGWKLGGWFDKRGPSVFLYGLISLALFVGSLAFVDSYLWRLFVAFGMGIILELLSVGSGELITRYTQAEHFGRVGGVMKTIGDVGSLTGPLVLGVLIDSQGFARSFFWLAVLIGVLAIAFFLVEKVQPDSYHQRGK